MRLALMAAFLVITPLQAKELRFNKLVNAGRLQEELLVAGIKVNFITTYGDKVVIDVPASEKKDAAPIVAAHKYVDLAKVDSDARAEIRRLALKWKHGDITADEKDQLLKLLVLQSAGLKPWE